jgi:Mn2+/Fe2+ NRAMP family transporter
MFDKLKKRWNINSNFQVVVILVVFAITGSTTVYIKKMIFDWIGITAETPLLLKIPVYIVVILTVYNILLLFVGFLFGQFRFFLAFERKFFSRLIPRKSKQTTLELNREL